MRLQQLAWLNDGFILLALMLLTACLGLLFGFVDGVYAVWGSANGLPLTTAETTLLLERLDVQTTVFIILGLTGIVAVKFQLPVSLQELDRQDQVS